MRYEFIVPSVFSANNRMRSPALMALAKFLTVGELAAIARKVEFAEQKKWFETFMSGSN